MLSTDELRNVPLFASLGEESLAFLARTVPDIHVPVGEYIVHEGDSQALYVVLDGKFELTKVMNGAEQVIAERGPGTFFGEVPIVLNSPFPANLRAKVDTRVIRLDPRAYHTVAAAEPAFSATVSAKAAERIGGLQALAQQAPRPRLRLVGPRYHPSVLTLRAFLHKNQVEFEWRAPKEAGALPAGSGAAGTIVQLADGRVLVDPSVPEVAVAVGLSIAPAHRSYDVVIVGGGPAGMAAAVYGASEGLRTLLVEREAPGGQAGTSSRIENYLGFPFGISGDDLAARALEQARRLGAEIVVTRSVEVIDRASGTVTLDGGDVLEVRSIVLAVGVTWRRLAIPSLDRLTGRGVYYGASRSEAGATHGRDIFLVGGGNSAGQAAMFFAQHARSVTLLVRGEALGLSMSHYLVEQLRRQPNIAVEFNAEVVGVHGSDQLEAIDVVNRRAVDGRGELRRRPAGGLFVFIGAEASTGWLPPEIALDPGGYVLTGTEAARTGRFTADRAPFLLETTAPGVFAVGDVRAGSVKRVASAVGDGSLAISFARQYLDLLAR